MDRRNLRQRESLAPTFQAGGVRFMARQTVLSLRRRRASRADGRSDRRIVIAKIRRRGAGEDWLLPHSSRSEVSQADVERAVRRFARDRTRVLNQAGFDLLLQYSS